MKYEKHGMEMELKVYKAYAKKVGKEMLYKSKDLVELYEKIDNATNSNQVADAMMNMRRKVFG